MHMFLTILCIVGLFVMGFIAGVWFASRKLRVIQVGLPNSEDLTDEEIEKIAKDLVDRMNKHRG